MLVSRSRPHTLATLVRSSQASFTTSSSSRSALPTPKPTGDSIFNPTESPWDHVFADVPEPDTPPHLIGTNTPHTRLTALDRLPHVRRRNGLLTRSSIQRKQRAAITAREMRVFDEMFNLIFDAVNSQNRKGKQASSLGSGSSSSPRGHSDAQSGSSTAFTAFMEQAPSIGRGSKGSPYNDLFRTLRRHTSRVRWTTEIDEELDRKKETMELFNTDQELLQWALKELFGETQQWDEEAEKVIAAAKDGVKDAGKAPSETTATSSLATTTDATTPQTATAQVTPTENASFNDTASSSSTTPEQRTLNPSIYPHLIAHVMRIFRTTYTNPSLSLAIFNHASKVSIPSYVFGCTAPVYNELIETKWQGWGDLEGVCTALEEMKANGVVSDGRTRIVVEKVRREVGKARPVELGGSLFGDEEVKEGTDEFGSLEEETAKEEVNPFARRVWVELGEAEVMGLLYRIEQLALRDRPRKRSPYEELWKATALKSDEDDGWSFDNWDEDDDKEVRKEKSKPRRQSSSLRWPERKKPVVPPRDWSINREEEMAFQ